MEHRLDATYLRPGVVSLTAAVAIAAVAIGIGILLAAWGVSLLLRYTPPEIVVRQDKPFAIEQPAPLKIDPANLTFNVEQQRPRADPSGGSTVAKAPSGDVIRREVIVFTDVQHGPGSVVTGWKYRDGAGGVPVGQFCYYTAPNVDHSSKKIDIASDGIRLS